MKGLGIQHGPTKVDNTDFLSFELHHGPSSLQGEAPNPERTNPWTLQRKSETQEAPVHNIAHLYNWSFKKITDSKQLVKSEKEF